MPPSDPPGNNSGGPPKQGEPPRTATGTPRRPGEQGIPGGRPPTGSVPAAPARTNTSTGNAARPPSGSLPAAGGKAPTGTQPAVARANTGTVPKTPSGTLPRPATGSVPAARPPTGSVPAARRPATGNVPKVAAPPKPRKKKRWTLLGWLFALFGICALGAIVAVAGYLVWAMFAPVQTVDTPVKVRGAPPPVAVDEPSTTDDGRLLIGKMLKSDDGKSLLDKQSVETRRKILIVDLFLQMTGGYPDLHQQDDWLAPNAPLGKYVDTLLKKGVAESEIANFVASTVMETPAWRNKMPHISQLKPSGKPAMWLGALPAYSAPAAGAMIARAVGYRKDIDRKNDALLIQKLADGYDALAQAHHPAEMLTRMLRSISGSTDVNEHWLADTKDDAVEIEAMKTNLRNGRWIVANGVDEHGDRRTIVIWGFTRKGELLVNDPAERFADRVPAATVIAFLRRPSAAGGPASGFWLDVSNHPTRAHCEKKQVIAKAAPEELFVGEGGMTGVIPGAQVGLTSLRIPPGEHTIRGTLTITAEQIDDILRAAHSPAAGYGASFVRWGRYYNVDPIYALAFFRRESVLGTHPRWIGRMPGGGTTRNIGNIRYVGRPDPDRVPQYHEYNGFRAYDTWDDGIHDWFKLLAQDSNYAGLTTVERILPRYAPSVENDTSNYIRDVITWVAQWRQRTLASGAKVASAAEAKKIEDDLMTCAPVP